MQMMVFCGGPSYSMNFVLEAKGGFSGTLLILAGFVWGFFRAQREACPPSPPLIRMSFAKKKRKKVSFAESKNQAKVHSGGHSYFLLFTCASTVTSGRV